ncbi:MAG: hypothetical protein ACYCWW_00040 [Deltaproteobacteria bacterium]
MSDGGLELDADARIFTLFAALNSLGYDEGPLARREPVPRPALSAARARIRSLAPVPSPLAARFQAFFDAHPAPLRAYVALVSSLGPPPEFAPGSFPAEAAALRGFEKLLAEYYQSAGVATVYAELLPQYRTSMNGSLTTMNAAFADADRLLTSTRGDQPAPPVVVLNLLGAPGSGFGERLGGGALLVIGPAADSDHIDVARAVEVYAQVRAGAMLEERAPAVRGLADLLARLRRDRLAGGELSAGRYLASCFSFAVAATAIPSTREAELGRAESAGCWISRSLAQALSEGGADGSQSPLDALLSVKLSSLDVRRGGPGLGDGR